MFLLVVQSLFTNTGGGDPMQAFMITNVLLIIGVVMFVGYRKRLKAATGRLADLLNKRPGTPLPKPIPTGGNGMGRAALGLGAYRALRNPGLRRGLVTAGTAAAAVATGNPALAARLVFNHGAKAAAKRGTRQAVTGARPGTATPAPTDTTTTPTAATATPAARQPASAAARRIRLTLSSGRSRSRLGTNTRQVTRKAPTPPAPPPPLTKRLQTRAAEGMTSLKQRLRRDETDTTKSPPRTTAPKVETAPPKKPKTEPSPAKPQPKPKTEPTRTNAAAEKPKKGGTLKRPRFSAALIRVAAL